jgi:hypothetical protein
MAFMKVEIERKQVDGVQVRLIGEQKREIINQKIWCYKSGTRHPVEMRITLPDGIKIYPEGFYILPLDEQIQPNGYSDLSFAQYSNFKLIPITRAAFDNFDQIEGKFIEALLPKAA